MIEWFRRYCRVRGDVLRNKGNNLKENKRDELVRDIINFCTKPRAFSEIMERCNYRGRKYFRQTFIDPLLDSGRLKMTIPEKPNSSKQKYVVVKI